MHFKAVPVTLKAIAAKVYISEQLQMTATIYFRAYHLNGHQIIFRDTGEDSPIKLHVPEQDFKVLFKKAGSLTELTRLLREHYNSEVQKRNFKLVPHHEDNLHFWYVDLEVWRAMKSQPAIKSTVGGVVSWTALYPKGTPERKEIHLHINEEGRKRRDRRNQNRRNQKMPARRFPLGI